MAVLIKEFKPLHPGLPSDPKTIMHTLRITTKQTIAGGKYIHFTLEDGIVQQLRRLPNVSNSGTIHLQFYIDGMTLFKKLPTSIVANSWTIKLSTKSHIHG